MIWNGPGVPAGKVVKDPVSTLDLGATFLDYADANAMLPQHGSSLKPLIETDTQTREFALNEWELLPTRTGIPLSLQTVRTETHKMTVDAISGAGELYDLVNDPHELTNIYDDPAAANLREGLQAMIDSRPDDRLPIQEQVGMA